MGQTMSAVGFPRYGTPEVLEQLEVARPGVAAGSVVIRVAAAGVNPADAYLRGGRFRLFARMTFPVVPGRDVAGVVAAVGSAVTRFRPGDPVYAMTPELRGGGYAEYASAREGDVAHAPAGISLAHAAAVPLAGLTALQALRDRAGLAPGDHLLVNGASGGVGSLAVQVARQLGARVTAACSERNAELVRDLGAEEVLDYASVDVTAAGARYDAVLDVVGGHPFRRWRRVLAPHGTAVTLDPLRGNPAARLLARATGGGRRLASLLVQPSGTGLATLAGWIEEGKVRVVIDRCYPLAEAEAAHRHIETQRTRGKIVLLVDAELAEHRPAVRRDR